MVESSILLQHQAHLDLLTQPFMCNMSFYDKEQSRVVALIYLRFTMEQRINKPKNIQGNDTG